MSAHGNVRLRNQNKGDYQNNGAAPLGLYGKQVRK